MSLAARITLLILAALLPFLALEGYGQYAARQVRIAGVHEQALHTTELIGRNVTTVAEDTRALLATIARLVPLTEPDATVCSQRLAGLLPAYPQFRNIAVLAANGRAVCTTARSLPEGGVNLGDRPYIREAAATREFVFAPYMTSPVSGAAIMPSVYPIAGRDNAVEGYVILTIDLIWLSQRIAATLPEKSAAVVANRSGTIIARSDEPQKWLGTQVAPEIAHLIGGGGNGTVNVRAADGAEHIVGYVNLPYGLFVATELYAPALLKDVDAATYFGIGQILAAILAAVIASMLVGHRFITRPVRAIGSVMRRWTAGDLGARVEAGPGESDLDALSRGLNEMIGRLELREAQFKRLNETLEERVAAQGRALRTEIEARREAEATLLHSQRLEAVGQLTGGVAHDFNNLLTVIKSGAMFVERRLKAGNTDVGRYVDAIRESADRATSLTQRLLAFARRQPLEPKPVDISKRLAGMIELLRRTIDEKIEIQTALSDTLRLASVDVGQLESAILNIAVNARDAMPDGGTLSIRTANIMLDRSYAAANEELVPGKYVMIEIADTGTGMSREQAARAFEPFFTTKEIGVGTGLGLSQVHGFVKQSGGHVAIDSEVGRGTTVRLYFPCLSGATEEVPSPARPTQVVGGSETILVVEDDEPVRAFTTEILESLGYRVLLAGNGPEALAILDHNLDISLLFTDVGLPKGMNGRQLAEEACRRRPALRVLYTTGYARHALMRDGKLEAGITVIAKPFTDIDIALGVRAMLDGAGKSPRVVTASSAR